MNLTIMSLAELRELDEKIRREIKKREVEALSKARDEILSIAQKLGVLLKEILTNHAKNKSLKISSHYRHPDNAALQWCGCGRKPGWINEWVEDGQSLDALKA